MTNLLYVTENQRGPKLAPGRLIRENVFMRNSAKYHGQPIYPHQAVFEIKNNIFKTDDKGKAVEYVEILRELEDDSTIDYRKHTKDSFLDSVRHYSKIFEDVEIREEKDVITVSGGIFKHEDYDITLIIDNRLPRINIRKGDFTLAESLCEEPDDIPPFGRSAFIIEGYSNTDNDKILFYPVGKTDKMDTQLLIFDFETYYETKSRLEYERMTIQGGNDRSQLKGVMVVDTTDEYRKLTREKVYKKSLNVEENSFNDYEDDGEDDKEFILNEIDTKQKDIIILIEKLTKIDKVKALEQLDHMRDQLSQKRTDITVESVRETAKLAFEILRNPSNDDKDRETDNKE